MSRSLPKWSRANGTRRRRCKNPEEYEIKPCLKCRKPFPSFHKFNRICRQCAEINDQQAPCVEGCSL